MTDRLRVFLMGCQVGTGGRLLSAEIDVYFPHWESSFLGRFNFAGDAGTPQASTDCSAAICTLRFCERQSNGRIWERGGLVNE